MREAAMATDRAEVGALLLPTDSFKETALRFEVMKMRADDVHRALDRPRFRPHLDRLVRDGLVPTKTLLDLGVEPYERREGDGNLLVYGGASAFFDLLIAAANVTAFNNANAYLGVGNSSTAAAATQTDLLGGSKNRQGMEASYPTHTDGTTSSNDSADFRSQWGTGDGNFAWEEWGLFNASSAGRMLNRKVESLGTKTSAAVWTLTATLSLA